MHISDQQLDTYRKQGFLIVENFLTDEERPRRARRLPSACSHPLTKIT